MKEPIARFSAIDASRRLAGILERLPVPTGSHNDDDLRVQITTLVEQVAAINIVVQPAPIEQGDIDGELKQCI